MRSQSQVPFITILPSTIAKILTQRDVGKVYKFLHPIREKWFRIGVGLELNNNKLADIRLQCKDDHTAGLWEMLQLWLRNRQRADLAKALTSGLVGEKDLADEGNNMTGRVILPITRPTIIREDCGGGLDPCQTSLTPIIINVFSSP
jgi:hypothetical protein